MNKPNIILCDIDGTIADLSHRLHYIDGETKDWDAFFKACVDDKPLHDIIKLLRFLHASASFKIVYLSGRSDMVRAETERWMLRYSVPLGELRMRKAGDRRPDFEVKADLLGDLTPEDVWLWLDDRDQVVNMGRAKGFRVLQVADGSF